MTIIRLRHWLAKTLSIAVLVLLIQVLADTAQADSSVRPPGNAVNIEMSEGPANSLGNISDSEIWRKLKQGNPADPGFGGPDTPVPSHPGTDRNLFTGIWQELTTQHAPVTSTAGQGRLFQVLGEDWRLFRQRYLLKYSPYVLLGVVGLLALFYLVRGRIMISGGRSGRTIPRFSLSHRISHWFLASTFIIMALSGLTILFGRPLLVEWLGGYLLVGKIGMDAGVIETLRAINAVMNSAALQGHNLFGPVFILSLLILIVKFMRGNFFQWADLGWILKGGGLLGGHASSNHYNFGEKTWYWIVVIVGLTLSATGLLLEFPWLAQTLAWYQLSTVLHAMGAVLMIAIAIGHAYIGSIGMEGSLDSMLRGEVDENWAREHHDLWYEEVTGKKATAGEDDDPGAPAVGEGAA